MSPGLARLVVAFCLAQVVFATWPALDLRVSALFHDPATGTWAGAATAPNLLREVLWKVVLAATALFLGLAIAGWRLGARAKVPLRLSLFAALSMIVAPGLLANALFKQHWGRARPRSIEEFGGTADFTPAFQIADQCASNCSFVAGEVAGAATLALVVWALARRQLSPTGARGLAAGLAGFVASVALLRLAAGGHFLSDTVFAVFLAAFVTRALWAVLSCEPAAGAATPAAIRADLAAALSAARSRLLALAGRGNSP